MSTPPEQLDAAEALLGYVQQQRWFAGRGGRCELVATEVLAWVGDDADRPRVRVELVTISTDGRPQLYQIPVSHYTTQQEHLAHALMCLVTDPGSDEIHYVYDALRDRVAIARLLQGFVSTTPPLGDLSYQTLGEPALDPDGPTLMITGEQSNTSLIVGDDLILKIFRKLDSGRNPDIEVHAALTGAGAPGIAALQGWITGRTATGSYDLAMLQDFLRSGSDGWEYARTSVRGLLMDPDLDPEHVGLAGGDFASESERLGAVTAELHAAMRSVLPTAIWGPDELQTLRTRLTHRLDEAIAAAPDLGPHRDAIAASYDLLGTDVAGTQVQRVHGDLHLGQTLRTVTGWVVLDFEGEPAKPLAERTALDSPWRDVAGMLRSFDYAASSVVTPQLAEEVQARGMTAWAARNREAFLHGYGVSTGQSEAHDPDSRAALLTAYELDKAVYEVVYETRNRPGWVDIPMAAVRRLASAG
ncbi:MAG: aminoglycoside phosphotransferase [Actinomycetota bacterium]|nr:aminoglycoside phosphotransferase [Actinomycetota bacterium]